MQQNADTLLAVRFKKKIIFSFSNDALNLSKDTFIIQQHISIKKMLFF